MFLFSFALKLPPPFKSCFGMSSWFWRRSSLEELATVIFSGRLVRRAMHAPPTVIVSFPDDLIVLASQSRLPVFFFSLPVYSGIVFAELLLECSFSPDFHGPVAPAFSVSNPATLAVLPLPTSRSSPAESNLGESKQGFHLNWYRIPFSSPTVHSDTSRCSRPRFSFPTSQCVFLRNTPTPALLLFSRAPPLPNHAQPFSSLCATLSLTDFCPNFPVA